MEGGVGDAGSTAAHLRWAARIKAQHYHLQQQQQQPPHRQRPGHGAGDSQASTGEQQSEAESAEAELRQWQAALATSEEEGRLRAYATAMHHLATRYWEARVDEDEGTAEDTASREKAGLEGDCREGIVKRAREAEGDAERVTTDALQQRLYNDRVSCSLACVETFLLGRPRVGTASAAAAPAAAIGTPAEQAAKQSDTNSGERGEWHALSPPPALYDVYPLILSRALKPLRRQFFQEHGRMATASECSTIIAFMVAENKAERACPRDPRRGRLSTVWDVAMDCASLVLERPPQPNPPVLRALDIGSCYGPFFGKSLYVPVLGEVPLAVTAMDLCPFKDDDDGQWEGGGERVEGTARGRQWGKASQTEKETSCRLLDEEGEVASTNLRVLRGDWLSLRFVAQPLAPHELPTGTRTTAGGRVHLRPTASHSPPSGVGADQSGAGPAAEEPEKADDEGDWLVSAVVANSFDVVFFCLLLSYMPTARLRYRACLHAYLALKPGGLLVIISTRTQGPRRSGWENQWIQCLAAMGFANVHKQARKKIVVLSFQKAMNQLTSGGTGAATAAKEETMRTAETSDIESWIAAKMDLPDAARGLPITADVHI